VNIPYDYYRYLQQGIRGNFQINTDYDANGDEVYSGIAEARALVTDPIWAIGKAVYTNNGTVNLLTHWSFVTGVAWSNRTSVVFP
jgi:hypothetical protein